MYISLLPLVVAITNIFLIIAFLIHLIMRFRNKPSSAFFLIWLLFWITLLIQYTPPLLSFFAPSLKIGLSVYFLNAMFLVLAYELADSGVSKGSFHSRKTLTCLIWFLIYTLLFGIAFAADDYAVAGYAWFLALALYTGRYQSRAPVVRKWIVVLLYVYASLDLLIHLPDSGTLLYWTFISMTVPLKVLLYYTGYLFLTDEVMIATSIPSKVEQARVGTVTTSTSAPIVSPPEPSIAIQLSGLWGFMYLLWRYPSGKIVVLFILAAILTAAMFLITNISAVIQIMKSTLQR